MAVAACGTQAPSPTGPTADPETPPPPPATVGVDWAALDRLYEDPLYQMLPRLVVDQAAASSLKAAVYAMCHAVELRRVDGFREALPAVGAAREEYTRATGNRPADRAILAALALYELHAWGILAHAATRTDATLQTVDEL